MTGESRKWIKFRIAALLAFFLVLFIALASRAFQLQILSGKALKALAQKQHTQILLLQPERGIIFDRNGEKMAATIMADSVCADPSKIENPGEVAGRLAAILQTDRAVLQKKLSGAKNFCWLARGIAPGTGQSRAGDGRRRNLHRQRTQTLLSQRRTGRSSDRLCRHRRHRP